MIRITIDQSRASAEDVEALKAVPGYEALMAAVKSYGRKLGVELLVLDRCQVAQAAGVGRVAEEPVPEHDMPEGSWVVQRENPDRPSIGKVANAYMCTGQLLLDIVLYSHEGAKIGRASPAMGGPRGFEPACGADNWEPIEKPDFELLGTKGFWGRHVKRLRTEAAAKP